MQKRISNAPWKYLLSFLQSVGNFHNAAKLMEVTGNTSYKKCRVVTQCPCRGGNTRSIRIIAHV